MPLRSYRGVRPSLGQRVYVAESAVVIGNVEVGDDASIWYGTVVRGDVNTVRIGARTNVQDNCTIHVTRDRWSTTLEEEVTVGHAAVLHGCVVETGSLIGIGSRVLDGSVIGARSLVGAGALVTPGTRVPPQSLVLGSPARVVRPLNEEELAGLERYWKNYIEYKNEYIAEEGTLESD